MGRQDWRTPPSVFDALSRKFGPFETDAASDGANSLCDHYCTEVDGIPNHALWIGDTWINPPFGDVMPWMIQAAQYDDTVIMLSHANLNSPWFRFGIANATLYLPDRRINYWHPGEPPRDGHHGGAQRDTAVWHFGGKPYTVQPLEIPEHRKEVTRLTAEANGQLTIGGLL